jgi:glycosyltransferase involved in cell wall biosynthesis
MALVSVILVCRNPGPRVRAAVASVLGQAPLAHGAAGIELEIVDGASSDGTVAWLSTLNADPRVRWTSAPDGGVYAAMNLGLQRARGTWCLFLGADDVLADSGVLAAAAPILQGSEADVVAGHAVYTDGRRYAPCLRRKAWRNFAHHQACFYRTDALRRLGGYDTSLRLQADYDLNLRLIRGRAGMQEITVLVARCAPGGLSDSGLWANYREEILVRHRHIRAWRALLWDAAAVARFVRKAWRRRSHFAHPESEANA